MWPFKPKLSILLNNKKVSPYQNAKKEVYQVIHELNKRNLVSDDEIRKAYFNLSREMRTNCDAAACGMLEMIGALCVHAKHLTPELLPSALRPI